MPNPPDDLLESFVPSFEQTDEVRDGFDRRGEEEETNGESVDVAFSFGESLSCEGEKKGSEDGCEEGEEEVEGVKSEESRSSEESLRRVLG